MTTPSIRDVSETARWVAIYRAMESARPDALFDDPLAATLAGSAGESLASSNILPPGARNHWPTVVRTKLVDDIVVESLARGCDRVINLGAGLDTRPYRLRLPDELTWHEADLPELIAYKSAQLADRDPHCRLLTRAVDVTDRTACAEFLAEAAAGARSVLVLTEGLLPYLEPRQVRVLSDTLRETGIRWWVLDHWSPVMLRAVNLTMGRQLGSARWRFASSLDFYDGWSVDVARSTFRAAARWKRAPLQFRPWRWVPETGLRRQPERSRSWCGAVRLANSRWQDAA
ncbi:SAM-dependent methyltransferase [Nocardia sp. NPDC004654]|uniref:class I SAM-dependent methyltransferase n=1 Tax=Nocardia sp. NPDC004654 TaxID=3154776 RepID=UPI0033BEE7FA